jgi:uncharacterized protein (TIGR02147 family)
MNKPGVYSYHDYRVFLKDLITFLQETQPDLSLRKLAEKSELAVGYLPMVLGGKRNLTEKALEALKKHLKLKVDEVAYLKYMMELNDSGSREGKLELVKKMQKFHKYQEENGKELEAYQYLTKWHYVALREMILLEDFKNDIHWIQDRLSFAVTPKDIQEALDFLLQHGFIEKAGRGKFIVKDKILDCFDGIYRLSLGEFYKLIYALAVESIDSVARDERLLLGHTFAVSNDSYEKVSAVLNEALLKIREIEKTDVRRDRVYQVSFAAFPLTKKRDN